MWIQKATDGCIDISAAGLDGCVSSRRDMSSSSAGQGDVLGVSLVRTFSNA